MFDGIRHQHINIVVRGRDRERAVVLSYIIVIQVSDSDGVVQDGMPRIIGHGVSRNALKRLIAISTRLTIRLHTDRIKLVVESEKLLAAGEAGR